ncbi:MAG: NAD-dependent epimerase/dehydratase family protein [Ktedonobacterales bacterium]
MKILVTGGAGFIGSHIVEAYVAEGHEVVVVDNLWLHGGGKLANVPPGVRFYAMSVTDPALAEVFEREQPEVVNHQAAQHSVKISTDDPAFDAGVNVLGLLNVLENCRLHAVRKVLFASSGATYGTPKSVPMSEDTPQWPESPYGVTKMAAEHYLRYYRSAYGLDYTAFRYGNVYGPRQDPFGEAGVIAIFARQLLNGESVRIDWDGEQAKDYVYAGDVARASVLALGHGGGRIYCLGTGRGTSVNELHRQLVRLTGSDTPVVRAPKRPGDVHLAYFDCSRARDELGWAPAVALEDGMRRTVNYFREAASEAAVTGTVPPMPVAEPAAIPG